MDTDPFNSILFWMFSVEASMRKSDRKFVILLTGATGFIGSSVLRQILDDGHIPIALVRRQSNQARIDHFDGVQKIAYDDISDRAFIEQIKTFNPDVFIHLAWKGVEGENRNDKSQISANIPFALSTVDLAHEVGCQQWIGIGSQAEYGNPNRRVDESYPADPTSIYGKAKSACYWATSGLCQYYRMTHTWLRIFSTYGPQDNPNWLIPYVVRELSSGRSPQLTKCEQLWDFLYVDDAARGILLSAYFSVSGLLNLGSGVARPLAEVIKEIMNILGTTTKPNIGAVPYKIDQVMHLEADMTKLKSQTGWEPQVDLSDGLRRTVDFFKFQEN